MSNELYKAAKKYTEDYLLSKEHTKSPEDHFKAGAEWCAKYIARSIKYMIDFNPKL